MTTRHRLRPASRGRAPGKKARRRRAARRHALRRTLPLYLAVGLGSAIGGSARWLASEMMHGWLGAGSPWGTLFVNVTGSFLIGAYAALAGPDGRLFPGPRQRHFVMTGICGGYTTFSIFSLETLRFVQAGRIEIAGLNVGVSALAWLVAVWLGYALAMRINQLKGM